MSLISKTETIQKAVDLIRKSQNTIVLTGAGISTPSGIPDFRSSKTGLWMQNDPFQVASLSAFRNRPKVFFDWLQPLAQKIWEAHPNSAHIALANLERAGYIQAIITQNIDGLHQKAGSQNVIEVHGSANWLGCPKCKQSFHAEKFVESFIRKAQIPHCPLCDSILKPQIVLFEEMLPMEAWSAAEWYCEKADLILVIGTSLEVVPAANLPHEALRHGARLIINTFSETHLDSYADVRLPYDVVTTLPEIATALL